MIYPFEDVETGERVELSMPMADAPSIGAVIEHPDRPGRRLRRVLADHVVGVRGFKPFRSYALPRHLPGVKHDAKGRAIFENRKQFVERMAQDDLRKDGWTYD